MTRYCVFWGENIMVWRSRRQTFHTKCSAEVEYRIVTMEVTKLLFLKKLLRDMGIDIQVLMEMFCDNKVVLNLSNNSMLYNKRKHIEIDHHFIKEKIDSNKLLLPYVKTQDQVADVFMKGCSPESLTKILRNCACLICKSNLMGSIKKYFLGLGLGQMQSRSCPK